MRDKCRGRNESGVVGELVGWKEEGEKRRGAGVNLSSIFGGKGEDKL